MLNPGTLVASVYQICHLIAEGGMAELYLARRLNRSEERRWVAIKRLKPHFTHSRDLVLSILHEARLINSLNHPNVVRGISHIQEDDEHFIIMEHVHGRALGDLCAKLAKKPFQARAQVALALGITLSETLAYLHEAGLVHADISPQNIMISASGQIKIVDFGSAIITNGQRGREGRLLFGNARYMSPEQRRGERITPKSDIYSLAQVLLEILNKEPSFALSHEAKELMEILHKASAPLVEKRFHNCSTLGARLKAIAPLFEVHEPKIIFRLLFEGYGRKKAHNIAEPKWPAFVVALLVFLIVILLGGCFGE